MKCYTSTNEDICVANSATTLPRDTKGFTLKMNIILK